MATFSKNIVVCKMITILLLAAAVVVGTRIEDMPPVDRSASIAIVGAGMSGLSTARRLIEHGFHDVHIFEGQDRVGGRIHSIPYHGGYLQMGAQFINGFANPLYEIANRIGVLGEVEEDLEVFDSSVFLTGDCPIDPADLSLFRHFTEPLDPKYRSIAQTDDITSHNDSLRDVYLRDYHQFLTENKISGRRRRVFDALTRPFRLYWEFEWASDWADQSLRNLVDWKDLELVAGISYKTSKIGYKGIIDYVRNVIPPERLHFSAPVANIRYDGPKATLTLRNGTSFERRFDYVVVSSSLGHLKKYQHSLFSPPIGRKMREAVEKIGFGHSQKIYLRWRQPFWTSSVFAPLPIEDCGCRSAIDPVEEELSAFRVLEWEPNTLVAWTAGRAPPLIDSLSDEELIAKVTRLLRDMHGNQTIPPPDELVRTRLTKNDMLLGSYSYVSVEQARARIPHSRLSMPLRHDGHPRVLFVGEHTHHRIFQTAVGAFLSGRREADRIKTLQTKNAGRVKGNAIKTNGTTMATATATLYQAMAA